MALPTLLDAIEALPAFTRVHNTLPTSGHSLTVGGLRGSSDAALVATLARNLPHRFFVVVAEHVADAERWLADLQALTETTRVAFYPPRESFGEAEAHAEVAGERVETLERAARGDVHILITTARAVLERTRLPNVLASGRLELRAGDEHRPTDLIAHLTSIGFEQTDMVDDVGQFSVRGGIFDIYGFGMAEPVRMEFWGDEISELRHFDLTSQRSTRPAEFALILPVDGYSPPDVSNDERVSIAALWAADTLVVIPQATHLDPEWQRTWDEAQHHLDLARRRGEDVLKRDELYIAPPVATAMMRGFGTLVLNPEEAAEVAFPIRPPDVVNRDINARETGQDAAFGFR